MELLAILLGSILLCGLVWWAIQCSTEYVVARSVRQSQFIGGLDICDRIKKVQEEPRESVCPRFSNTT
jgi:hypothetical protein